MSGIIFEQLTDKIMLLRTHEKNDDEHVKLTSILEETVLAGRSFAYAARCAIRLCMKRKRNCGMIQRSKIR